MRSSEGFASVGYVRIAGPFFEVAGELEKM